MEKQVAYGLIGNMAVIPTVKIKYCLYSRKSTESSESQILSIESQVKEMLAVAEREKLEVVDIKREAHSAKDSGQRPIFSEIIQDIKQGKYNGILTWAPDRLSRNAGDLGSLVDLMDQKLLLQIKTYGQSFQNSPNEKFLLMILCSQAKLENDNKSINVRRGLRTRCEMGLRPAQAPVGYISEKRLDKKCSVLIDHERAPMIKKMFEKVAYEKCSGRRLYNWLKFEIKFKTIKGKEGLSLGNIYVILNNPFYYGVFEYPKKSGNWYTGKHEPIITKELFDLAQEQISEHLIKSENKEFAFTKLMVCGLCGSSITADEKFKKQKNGNVHRYVYYGCTKSKDRNCKSGYINESDLVKQFEETIDQIDVDVMAVNGKIKEDLERFKKFQKILLNNNQKLKVKEIDVKNYAKYILQQGTDIEKRELLGCLKGQIMLDGKKILIKKAF